MLADTVAGTHRVQKVARVLYSLRFSPDGSILAVTANEGGVHLFDPATGRERAALQGPSPSVIGAAFAPDGRLASGEDDGRVVV